MRQVLLVLFIGLPGLGFGQAADWSIIPSVGQTYFYRTDSVSTSRPTNFWACTPYNFTLPRAAYWEQIRTDSVYNWGALKVYRTNRYFNFYSGFNGNDLFNLNTPGILGDSILENPRTGVFRLQDSTFVFSKARLGDTLLRQGRPSSSFTSARVTRVGVDQVNGVLDSIKVAEGGFILSRRHGVLRLSNRTGYDTLFRKQAGFDSIPTQLPTMNADSVLDVVPGDEVHIKHEAKVYGTSESPISERIRRKFLSVDLSRSDTAVYLVQDSLVRLSHTYGLNCQGPILTRVDTTLLKIAKADFEYVKNLPFDPDSSQNYFASGTVREDSLGVYFYTYWAVETGGWVQYYRHVPFGFRCGKAGFDGTFDCEKPVYIQHKGLGKGNPLHLRSLFTADRPPLTAELRLEPNPAKTQVRISTNEGALPCYFLVSSDGRSYRLKPGPSGIIDLHSMVSGLYTVEAMLTDSRVIRKRLLIEP